MSRRAVLPGLLLWGGSVVVGSGVTWLVIDSAGQEVLAGPSAAVPSVAATASPSPGASRSVTPTASKRTERRSHRSRRDAGEHAGSPTATSRATPAPVPSPAGRPSAPGTVTGQPAERQSPPATRTRTWQGPPGSVVAYCTGTRIRLESATPNNGYRVEVGSRGPAELEVTFTASGASSQTQVKAVCRAGAPTFSSQREGGDDRSERTGPGDDG